MLALVICFVALLTGALLWNVSPIGKLIWVFFGLAITLLCLPVLVACFGIMLGKLGRLYGPAHLVLRLAEWLTSLSCYRLFGSLNAYPALELSDLFILSGDYERAADWALKANRTADEGKVELATLPEDVQIKLSETCPSKVRAFSNAGLAWFLKGELERATDYLQQSWQQWGRQHDLDGNGVEFQARNLDLLARIELRQNNIQQAAQLFERGIKLRSETDQPWRITATTYKLNALASLSIARGDLIQAEQEMIAEEE